MMIAAIGGPGMFRCWAAARGPPRRPTRKRRRGELAHGSYTACKGAELPAPAAATACAGQETAARGRGRNAEGVRSLSATPRGGKNRQVIARAGGVRRGRGPRPSGARRVTRTNQRRRSDNVSSYLRTRPRSSTGARAFTATSSTPNRTSAGFEAESPRTSWSRGESARACWKRVRRDYRPVGCCDGVVRLSIAVCTGPASTSGTISVAPGGARARTSSRAVESPGHLLLGDGPRQQRRHDLHSRAAPTPRRRIARTVVERVLLVSAVHGAPPAGGFLLGETPSSYPALTATEGHRPSTSFLA
jgi:hypothetical protein